MGQLIKKLDKIIELLLEEKENRERVEGERVREERERMLMEYAKARDKKLSAPRIHTSRELEELPIKGGQDAIPYGLSNGEKEILELWYGRGN